MKLLQQCSNSLPFVKITRYKKALCAIATMCLLYCLTDLPGHVLIGQAGTILFVLIFILSIGSSLFKTRIPAEWPCIAIMGFIILLHTAFSFSSSVFVDAAQQILFLLLIGAFCVSAISENDIAELSRYAAGIFILLTVLYSVAYVIIGEQRIQSLIVPDFTKVLFAGSFFCVMAQKNERRRVAVCFFLALCFWIMREGSAAILIALFPIIKRGVKALGKVGFSAYRITFLVVLLLLIIFPIMYLELYNSPQGAQIQEWVGANLQRRLFNGREVIWSLALQEFEQSPLIGHGLSSVLFKVGDQMLTTHNLYLYLGLEGGIILLGVFLVFLYIIWKRFWPAISNDRIAYGVAFFVLILIMMDYELALFSKTVVSLFLWLAIGLNIAMANHLEAGDAE